ncbi:MAG: glycine betaine ABC transporter substrate-binding protein [Chloroflexota bacterium]
MSPSPESVSQKKNYQDESNDEINTTPSTTTGTIAVGSRDFTEQLLLGQILIITLEEAGYEVIDKTGLGGTNSAHDAIKAGEVDIIWEYIGTILSESHFVAPDELPSDLNIAFNMVAAMDARDHNLFWLSPSAFNDTYTLMIREGALDEQLGETFVSIDDLANYMNEHDSPLSICVENEFYSRGDGLFSLQQHYEFAFQEENILIVAYDQLYEGLRDGLCDISEGFSTDGRISAWNFQNLDDSRSFFPAYNASPIIRADTLARHPEIGDLLFGLGPKLDNDKIAALNARIDIGADGLRNTGDEEPVRDVARSFLEEIGAIAKREAPKPTITVGSRDFTEQLLLGQIIVTLLKNSDFDVIDKTGLGGTNSAHDALKAGEVDIIWDYIGTILSESHGLPPISLPSDSQVAFEMVRGLDKHHHNLVWLEPSAFNDTYTLMFKPDFLEAKTAQTFTTIRDLADYMNTNESPLTVCVENEFYSRGDGLLSLQKHYGFAFQEENIQLVAYDQLYEGLRNNLCDVAEGFSTDGRISAWNFQNLVDSEEFFPAYNASPIVREDVIEQNPGIEELLNKLGRHLDNDTIAQLNARIDIGADGERNSGDEELIEDVAADFLFKNRLLTQSPQIVVGSRDFTEQLLLGQILIGALEHLGFDPVDKTGLGGTNSAHDSLKAGEVDIIWDYIGTILSESHGMPPSGLPADTKTALEIVRGLDEFHHDLVWLEPTAFNDTYTMMVRPDELADTIGEELLSIEDLARFMNQSDSLLTICVENEFYSRGDGLFAMQEHYGFTFREENILIVAYDQLYEGLRDGLCNVAEGFSTDGRIASWGFRNLDDSLEFFPAYNASPIVRREVIEEFPEIGEFLNQLALLLDNETITSLNARIDIGEDGLRNSGDEESVQDVAMSFLTTTNIFDESIIEE